MVLRLGCRHKSQSFPCKSVRLRKVSCFFHLPVISSYFSVKFDFCSVTLVILSLLSNYLTDYCVLAKPGAGAGEPLYLELGQNFTNNPFNAFQHSKFPLGSSSQVKPESIPEAIRASLSSFCEKCSDSQKKKVEQILLLLFNFNQEAEEQSEEVGYKHENFSTFPSSTPYSSLPATHNKHSGINKPLKKVKKTFPDHEEKKKKKVYLDSSKKYQFHVTSLPKSSAFVPTPEIQYYHNLHSNEYPEEYHGVIQLPTTSTTPAPSTPVLPSRVLSLYPKYNSFQSVSFPTHVPSPGNGVSTTVSSALGPVQSVEMPTPPMPPTTSGPIYVYYLGPSKPSTTTASSSSVQPPTTPVVESSLASRPTTLEP